MISNNLKVYKNIKQSFVLSIRNLDRKLLKVDGLDFFINIIDPNNAEFVIKKLAKILDADKGRMEFEFFEGDLVKVNPGTYQYSITYFDNSGNENIVYLDQAASANAVIEVLDSALPKFRPSFSTDVFYPKVDLGDTYYFTEKFPGDGLHHYIDGQHTVAVYCDNFKGHFFIEATLEENPGELDWFEIVLIETYTNYEFDNFTGIEGFNFKCSVPWLRFKYLPHPQNTGTVEKILYRQ